MDSKLDTISQAMDKHGLSRDEQVAPNVLPASEPEMSRLRAELDAVKAARARDTTASSTTMLTTGVPAIDRVLLGAQGMTLRDVVETVIASRRLVFSVIALVISSAALSTWLRGPVYRANALVHVTQTERSLATALGGSASFIEDEATVAKELQILESRSVLGSVVNKLQLDIAAKPLRFPVVGAAIAATNRSGDSAPGVWFVSLGELWPLLSTYAWGGEHITVDVFDVPVTYMGEDNQFTVVAGQDQGYVLLDPSGQRLESGTIGALIEVPLPDNERLRLRVTELRARPGVHFTLMRNPRIAAAADLDKNLNAKEQSGTTGSSGVMLISYSSENPKTAATVVNEVINTYMSQHVAHKGSEAQRTLQYMQQQLPPLKEALEAAEEALSKFRLQRGTADLTQETQALLRQILSVEATRSELLSHRNELLRKSTPQSTQAPAARPDVGDSARETLRRFRAGRSAEIAAADAQANSLNKDLERLNAKVKNLPSTQQEILRLSRAVEFQSEMYTSLLHKTQELKVAKEGIIGNVSVVDYADVPVEPASRKPIVDVSIAAVVGGVLAVGLAFIRKAYRSAVEDPQVIEKRFGLPIYATIFHSPTQNKVVRNLKKARGIAVLAVQDSDDVAIEGVRSLRTMLHFALFNAKSNVLALTSSVPGVGKSFITANLGAVIAQTGKRVLLIDGDLRRGIIHEYFGIERGDGLSDFISGDVSMEQIIRGTGMEGLEIVTTGSIPPNPSELLLHKRFGQLVDRLSADYDQVLIDTPPILAVTDAAIIGRLAGVTLLVLKAGLHPLREVEEAVKRLRHTGGNLGGAVFNDIEVLPAPYGSGKYGYSYAYKKK